MIQVSELTKYYQKNLAVDGLTFHIQKNEVAALLGLNGAGKTTTLRMLTGFLTPTKGNITVNSYDSFSQSTELKKQIGYLPEMPSLYPDMKVNDFLQYIYRIRMYSKHKEQEAIEQCLGKVNLLDKSQSLVGTLSAGYRKRVGIAQAIVHNPPVLILDEPISELDPIQIIEMRNLILSLRKEHTVLISSHILSEVSQTANHFLFIKNGKLIGEETKKSLQTKKISLEKLFLELNQ